MSEPCRRRAIWAAKAQEQQREPTRPILHLPKREPVAAPPVSSTPTITIKRKHGQ